MARTSKTPEHRALAGLIRQRRKAVGLTQMDVVGRLGRPHSFITDIERAGRRLDVVELLNLAEAIGFDVHDLIDELIVLRKEK